ncbi:MAG: HAMP domain-containing histidine kinase [Oscillospiraceae bacterium]|nr:HAMP domain-containing histidine kinase [Oscillospiraceae bacterium]
MRSGDYYGEDICMRENLQDLFDLSFKIDDREKMREQYKTLRSLELGGKIDFVNEAVDVSALTENATTACDILVSDTGTNFVFCGNDTSPAAGNARLIMKAVLNLLSNAYFYGRERLVTTKTIETASHIKIEVQSGGGAYGGLEYGRGLRFVRNVCLCHGGNFFVEQSRFSVRAVMLLPKAEDCKEYSHIPDLYSLISDRLSPVYIEFFGRG